MPSEARVLVALVELMHQNMHTLCVIHNSVQLQICAIAFVREMDHNSYITLFDIHTENEELGKTSFV